MSPQPHRYFLVTFYCEACPNEFSDPMAEVVHSWCPSCDGRCEPDSVETIEQDTDQ